MKIVRLSHSDIDRLMLDTIAEARRRGVALASLPFRPDDVDGIHTDRAGLRDGVWFRLTDGRVFDDLGRDCDPNPELYDTLQHS
jgi:hypothetical protein